MTGSHCSGSRSLEKLRWRCGGENKGRGYRWLGEIAVMSRVFERRNGEESVREE